MHERAGAAVQAGNLSLGDDAQLSALAGRCVADDSKLGLQPRQLAFLGLALLLGVAPFALGLLGGLLVATSVLEVTPEIYLQQAWDQLTTTDVWRGLIKTGVFGVIVGAVGCYQGFQVKGGAEGVGRVTTNAVVSSILLVIVTDAILDYFLLFRF